MQTSTPLRNLVSHFTERYLNYRYTYRRYIQAAEAFFENQWKAGTLAQCRPALKDYLRASGFSFLRVAHRRDYDIIDLSLRLRSGSNVRGRALGYYGSSDHRLKQLSQRHLNKPPARLSVIFSPQFAASTRTLPSDCIVVRPLDLKRLFVALATDEYLNEYLYVLSAIPLQKRQLNRQLRARVGLELGDVLAISKCA